jgi:hypothetical protein
MATEPEPSSDEAAPHLTAEQARGGEIVLRSRGRRVVFIAGLALVVLLAIILRVAGYY